jgi:uncharacterized protein
MEGADKMENKPIVKMLVLSLTGQCNFACAYCYAAEHPKSKMSLETAFQAVDFAAVSRQPFLLQFSGGEPLLAFDVMKEVIEYVHKRRIPAIMQVQSNASLFNGEIASYLHEKKVGIGISLDGRPQVNDRLRHLANGEGTSRKILVGAAAIAARGVEIGITCVVSKENVLQLSGVVEMAYYLGNVRRLGFDLLRGQGRGSTLVPPTADEMAQGLKMALKTAEHLERQTGRKLLISQVERVEALSKGTLSGFAHCHSMNGQAAFVDAEGNLYACSSLVGDPKFHIGHVSTGFDATKQQKVTTMIQQSMAFCRNCPRFALCGGGCFARWYGSGCQNEAYDVECELKKGSIDWFERQKKQAEHC